MKLRVFKRIQFDYRMNAVLSDLMESQLCIDYVAFGEIMGELLGGTNSNQQIN